MSRLTEGLALYRAHPRVVTRVLRQFGLTPTAPAFTEWQGWGLTWYVNYYVQSGQTVTTAAEVQAFNRQATQLLRLNLAARLPAQTAVLQRAARLVEQAPSWPALAAEAELGELIGGGLLAALWSALTAQERAALVLTGAGQPRAAMAAELGVSPQRVSQLQRQILTKYARLLAPPQ